MTQQNYRQKKMSKILNLYLDVTIFLLIMYHHEFEFVNNFDRFYIVRKKSDLRKMSVLSFEIV